MGDKIKVLWCSDLVTPTGFSRVSHSVIEYLPKEDYTVTGLGVNYYGDPHEYDFEIYPATLGGDLYGLGRLQLFAKRNMDIIFILNDAWVVAEYLKAIKQVFTEKRPKIVVYTPVDAKEHDPDWYKDFDIVDQLVVYTEFARLVINKAAPHLNTVVIPHGVDTKRFYKMDIDKRVLKKEYFKDKVKDPEDLFIIFSGQRNQPRKKLDITLEAFKLFVDGKPENVKLYLHAGVKDSYIDLIKYAKRLEIDERVLLTNLMLGTQAVPIEKLNLIYNLCDIGVNTGLGEGWGLVNIEHAVTGAPQVVPNHSALTDLYSDCGILIEPSFKWVQNSIMTVGEVVTAEDFAEGLELLYTDKRLYNSLSKASIAKFSSDEFSWKTVSGMFDKVFREVLEK